MARARRWRRRTLTLCGLLVAGAVVPADRAAAGTQEVQIVEVTAERFSFTPSEIRAKAGVPVEIRLESEDTDHGFRILGTKVDVRIPKRNKGQITITFAPPAPGRYTFECSHVCGAGHSFMRGEIVVTK